MFDKQKTEAFAGKEKHFLAAKAYFWYHHTMRDYLDQIGFYNIQGSPFEETHL
jgi:hypothetical protein